MNAIEDAARSIYKRTGVELLTGSWEPLNGLSNDSFKVTLPNAVYVLRIPPPDSHCYIDRAIEAHNTACAAELGFCEKPLYHDLSTGVRLTPFIDAAPINSIDERNQFGYLELVATALRQLHSSNARFKGERDIYNEIARYRNMALPNAPLVARLKSTIETMGSEWGEYGRGGDPVPSHIDLTPGNLLYSRRSRTLHIIDWEFSGMANPIWDLATVALDFHLTPDQEHTLMAAYDGCVMPEKLAALRRYKYLIDLLACAWALARAAKEPHEAEWLAYAEQRLESGKARREEMNV